MSMKTLNIKHTEHYGIENNIKKVGFLTAMTQTVLAWQERASMRYRLAELDKQNLSDIGLSHHDLMMEAQKPFWQN